MVLEINLDKHKHRQTTKIKLLWDFGWNPQIKQSSFRQNSRRSVKLCEEFRFQWRFRIRTDKYLKTGSEYFIEKAARRNSPLVVAAKRYDDSADVAINSCQYSRHGILDLPDLLLKQSKHRSQLSKNTTHWGSRGIFKWDSIPIR